MDKNVKIIYNKLDNITINNQGYIDLSNSKIQGQNDLINICSIFRDPRYETFRVFYMKDNKIVGQEAITSKIPDAVLVFDDKERHPIRIYEKMINRMERLDADGYYLAHNHPSGSAKPSQKDMELTRNFAANVEGFLGHIVIGSNNRYSIIEENSEGLILMPKEQILNNSTIKNMEEELKSKTLYDVKISSRDELVALLKQINNDKEYSTAILTDVSSSIRMVLDIPNRMFNQEPENLNGFFKNIARNSGAIRVFIGTQNVSTYNEILKHQKYGTIKDMIYFNKDHSVIRSENIIESQELFDKEKLKKIRKNKDAR